MWLNLTRLVPQRAQHHRTCSNPDEHAIDCRALLESDGSARHDARFADENSAKSSVKWLARHSEGGATAPPSPFPNAASLHRAAGRPRAAVPPAR